MTNDEAVSKIADAYADAEAKASSIKQGFQGCKDAWETLRDGAVIGGLEMQHRFRRLNAAAVAFEAELFAFHVDDTNRAKELGVDLPGIFGGGGR